MGRYKEPVALIKAKGTARLTKAEMEERERLEVKVDLVNVVAPEYLGDNAKKEFYEISDKLLQVGIMTELDEDCLARYILAKQNYLQYTSLLNKAIKNKEAMAAIEKIQNMQDKAFKQCNSCARELGLTISSRCKLIAPAIQQDNQQENKFKKFQNIS